MTAALEQRPATLRLRDVLQRPDVRLALAAVVAWFACGLLHAVGTRVGAPAELVGLLAPWTPATSSVREPLRGLAGTLVVTATLVGVLLLAVRPALRPGPAGTALRALVVWSAVVLAGVAATAVGSLGSPYAPGPVGVGDALASGALDGVRRAGGWGAVYGGLVTLAVLGHLRRTSPPTPAPGGPRAAWAAALAGATAALGWTTVAFLHVQVDALVNRTVTTPRSTRAAAVRTAADWLLPVSSGTDALPVVVVVGGLLVGGVTAGLTWVALRRDTSGAPRGLLVRAVWLAGVVAATLGPAPTLLAPDTYDPEAGGWWLLAQRALQGPTDGGAAGLLLGWVAALVVPAVLGATPRVSPEPTAPVAPTVPGAAGGAAPGVRLLGAAVPAGVVGDGPGHDDAAAAPGATDDSPAAPGTTDPGPRRRGAWLRDPRVLVPVLAVVLWPVSALLHRAARLAGLPDAVVGLLLPTRPTAATQLGGAAVGLIVLAVVAYLAARPVARARTGAVVPRALAVWFAVVVAGVASAAAQAVVGVVTLAGMPSTDLWPLVAAFDVFAPLRASAGWGVVHGAVVALVVTAVAWRDARPPRRAAGPAADRAAAVAAVLAGALAGGGWLALVSVRASARELVTEHGYAHPELAWDVATALDWLAPVASADGAGPGAVALSALGVAGVAGALTWWATSRAASTGGRTPRAVLVAAVWLACVVAATFGPVPTVDLHGTDLSAVESLPRTVPSLGPTQGGAAGMLFGWLPALAVVVTVGRASRRRTDGRPRTAPPGGPRVGP